MKQLTVILIAFLVVACGTDMPASDAKVGEKAPAFTLIDSNGESHNLSDFEGKYVVLEWVNFGCPFVAKHYDSGNMQELQSWAAEHDIVWLSICSSAEGKQGYMENDELNETLEEKGFAAAAYLVDASGDVGQSYGAKTTPHMYVINPEGTLIYAGAIDDKPTTDVEDVEGATNYVVNAVTAAKAGQDIEVNVTKPYGCSVKY